MPLENHSPYLMDHESQYVQEAFCLAVGLKKDFKNNLPQVPLPLQRLFLRKEESENQERDQWGNWEHSFSDNYQRGKLWRPECDEWICEQRELLKKTGHTLPDVWPHGHRFAICLTHDVDYIGETATLSQRYRELLRSALAKDLSFKQKISGSTKNLAKLLLKATKKVPKTTHTLETSYLIEKDLGVSASYFFTTPPHSHMSRYDCLYGLQDRCEFLGRSCRVKDILSQLVQEGFDVGLHGSYFSAIEEGLLKEQKNHLESQIGAQIHTTRQHWLHFHHSKTQRLQEKAGLLADSTLGFNRNIGYRAGTGLPHFAYDREEKKRLSLIETPMIIQDGALIGNNALEYSPEKALEIAKKMIARTKETQSCSTLLFHPDIFLKPGLSSLYRSLIRYCLDENGWVTDLNQIQQWWRKREKDLS